MRCAEEFYVESSGPCRPFAKMAASANREFVWSPFHEENSQADLLCCHEPSDCLTLVDQAVACQQSNGSTGYKFWYFGFAMHSAQRQEPHGTGQRLSSRPRL